MMSLHRTRALLLVLGAGCSSGPAPEPPAPGPAQEAITGSTPGTPEPAIGHLAEYLGRLETLGFSGAAIVEHQGEIVLERGYGLADRENRRPYATDTVQTHGSITKQITAAAILLLETRGDLALTDRLGDHLDRVPEDKREITLHQLLTHTAGLPPAVGSDNEPIGPQAFLERVFAAPLLFEPGERFEYSNVGYSLLGILIERVSDESYEEFLRRELLLPAGLSDTGYLLPKWKEKRLAVGYNGGERWGRIYQRGWRVDGPGWHLRANGGLHTTIGDMHRWLAVLRGRGVLSPATVAGWIDSRVEAEEGVGYAYGWESWQTPIGPMIAHNGGNGVFSADFVWLPDAELFFYLQGNSSIVYAAQLREALLAALFDPGFALPPRLETDPGADPETAGRLIGSYRAPAASIELEADDVRLRATIHGQAALDAALRHPPQLRRLFAELNPLAERAMTRILAAREDAFEGLVEPDEDAAARARRLLERADARGIVSIELVGTIENAVGTRFEESGPWTTFFRARSTDGEEQAWSFLWRENRTYRGTAIGPTTDFPAYVLVPQIGARWAAVEHEPPWRRTEIGFAGPCLLLGELHACRPDS